MEGRKCERLTEGNGWKTDKWEGKNKERRLLEGEGSLNTSRESLRNMKASGRNERMEKKGRKQRVRET